MTIQITYQVGDFFRFVPLPDGGAIEVKNSFGNWIRQDEWPTP